MSTWIALSAAPPYIPECRSRSPVRTLTSTPTRPRVASSIVGHVAPQHSAVEDHAGVGAALVLRDPVGDRVAADLLLAVERDAEVDRQRARLDEPLRGLEHEPELALVVGDAARRTPTRRGSSSSNGSDSQSSSGAGGWTSKWL